MCTNIEKAHLISDLRLLDPSVSLTTLQVQTDSNSQLQDMYVINSPLSYNPTGIVCLSNTDDCVRLMTVSSLHPQVPLTWKQRWFRNFHPRTRKSITGRPFPWSIRKGMEVPCLFEKSGPSAFSYYSCRFHPLCPGLWICCLIQSFVVVVSYGRAGIHTRQALCSLLCYVIWSLSVCSTLFNHLISSYHLTGLYDLCRRMYCTIYL